MIDAALHSWPRPATLRLRDLRFDDWLPGAASGLSRGQGPPAGCSSGRLPLRRERPFAWLARERRRQRPRPSMARRSTGSPARLSGYPRRATCTFPAQAAADRSRARSPRRSCIETLALSILNYDSAVAAPPPYGCCLVARKAPALPRWAPGAQAGVRGPRARGGRAHRRIRRRKLRIWRPASNRLGRTGPWEPARALLHPAARQRRSRPFAPRSSDSAPAPRLSRRHL